MFRIDKAILNTKLTAIFDGMNVNRTKMGSRTIAGVTGVGVDKPILNYLIGFLNA